MCHISFFCSLLLVSLLQVDEAIANEEKRVCSFSLNALGLTNDPSPSLSPR